jgi:hypothetical protein
MQQSFNSVAVRQYDETVEYEAKALVNNILQSPENFRRLLRQYGLLYQKNGVLMLQQECGSSDYESCFWLYHHGRG